MSKDNTARLYVGGFPHKTTQAEIKELCSRFGKVISVDIIPRGPGDRHFGFVTFASKSDANTALYGLPKESFKGCDLEVDWAKVKRDDRAVEKPVEVKPPPVVQEEKKPENGLQQPRYIPGSDTDPSHQGNRINGEKQKKKPVQSPVSPRKPAPAATPSTPPPTPVTSPSPPDVRKYSEVSPELEVTIRDTVTHELKYQFRVKSLSALQEFLIAEGDGIEPSQLLLASTPKTAKDAVNYNGTPVVHVYEDTCGMEMLEARENKAQRDKNIAALRKKKTHIPAALVPLTEKRIPKQELIGLLTQKGYFFVYLNTSSVNGPLAPLHPSWKPIPNSFAYRKGNAIVFCSVQGEYISSCELFSSTNNTYKDILPILTKYDICIFNVLKQAFIAPEQLK